MASETENEVCTCNDGPYGDVMLALIGKNEFEVCFLHRTYRPYGWKSCSLWLHVPMRAQLETAAKMDGFVDPADGVRWDAAVAEEHIREFFAPRFADALKADPTLTREQLENMSIDDMP
jgi:hypothetical protein